MTKDEFYEPIKVKNPLCEFLPNIELTMETKNTDFVFTGAYNGTHTLPAKLLKVMTNEEIIEKGADKTNDER